MSKKLINDSQRLVGAKSRFGHKIATYDDGYGPLFIHRDSMGISGIVRAQTWEDAYSICEDEFFPAGDEDANEEAQKIEAMPDGEEKNHEQACWDEAYGFRGNGRKESDGSVSHIYAKDLNGDSLEMLTPKLLEELEITLEITGPKWKVVWDNGNHASGEFQELHDTEEAAEAAGKEWVSNMEMSDPDAPEGSYTFDVLEVEDQPITNAPEEGRKGE